MGKIVSRRTIPGTVDDFICRNCGVQQTRASACVECGAPRDPANTTWVPSNRKATMADVQDAKNTIKCDACLRPYPKTFESCPHCGEGTQGNGVEFDPAERNLTQEYRAAAQRAQASVQTSRNSYKATPTANVYSLEKLVQRIPPQLMGLGKIALVVAVAAICVLVMIAASVTHAEPMTVMQHESNFSVEVSYIYTSSGECWEGSCPSFTRQTGSSNEMYSSGEMIKVGETQETCYKCKPVQSCGEPTITKQLVETCETKWEDGVSRQECETELVEHETPNCTTTYEDEITTVDIKATATPYQRLKIYYETDEKKTKDIETGWVLGTNNSYPNYQLGHDENCTGNKSEEYRLVLVDTDQEQHHYYISDQSEWLSYSDSLQIIAHVNWFGIQSIEIAQ